MAIRLMLTVELASAERHQRRNFSIEMRNRGWSPLRSRGTVFCTEITGDPEDAEIVSMSEADVRHAAIAACIKKWSCVCVLEDDEDEEVA